jgi:hypothetical protein
VCLHARTRADNLAVLTNDCSQLLRTVETGTGLLQQGTPSSIVNDELGHDLLPAPADDGLSKLDDIADQMTGHVNVGHIRRNSGGGQGWPKLMA